MPLIRLRSSWLAMVLVVAALLPSANALGDKKKGKKSGSGRKAAPVEQTPRELTPPPPPVEAPQPIGQRAPNDAGRPWAKGVSEEDQQAAWALFREGNSLLKDAVFTKAADKYREALQRWDHPAIHYNLALALLNLDQPVQVYEHLEKALAYGVDPLDPEKFDHAKSYKQLIGSQLALVHLKVDEPGAAVSIDGQTLFTAPGSWNGRVRSGSHTILASKEGYLTSEKTKNFEGGSIENIDLKLYKGDSLTQYRRSWPVWQPWAVAGGGAAFLIAGGILHWQSTKSFSAYDDGIIECTNSMGGMACNPSADLASKKSDAELFRAMAIVSYGIGAAALVTGATLVYMNRERPYRINPVERDSSVSVVPVMGPGVGGVQATFSF